MVPLNNFTHDLLIQTPRRFKHKQRRVAEAVALAVAEVLARSENQPKLRYLAAQASLYSLVHFLSFVLRPHLPPGIFDTASGDLREPSCWPAMFEKHKTTPAFHFKGTLEFTDQHFPAFHAALSAELKGRDG